MSSSARCRPVCRCELTDTHGNRLRPPGREPEVAYGFSSSPPISAYMPVAARIAFNDQDLGALARRIYGVDEAREAAASNAERQRRWDFHAPLPKFLQAGARPRRRHLHPRPAGPGTGGVMMPFPMMMNRSGLSPASTAPGLGGMQRGRMLSYIYDKVEPASPKRPLLRARSRIATT
jgi:hypothetical protein